jgi:hypothetical protein
VNKRQVLDIVFIVFGLYFFMSLVGSLASLTFSVFMEESEYMSKGSIILMTGVHCTVLLLLTGLFLFKRKLLLAFFAPHTDEIDGRSTGQEPCYARLAFWIQILGLYYFIASVSKAIGQLAIVVSTKTRYVSSHLWWNQMGPHLVAVVIAALFIWKSEAIAHFITRIARKKDTQPKPESDATV